jgi:hypothetical protein
MNAKTTPHDVSLANALGRISEVNRPAAKLSLARRTDLSDDRRQRIAKALSIVDRHMAGRPWTAVPGPTYREWLGGFRGQTLSEYGRYLRGFHC